MMNQQQVDNEPPQYQLQEPPPIRQTNYQTMPNESGFTRVYMGEPQFNGFSSKGIRAAFVSKVFSIVAVQLFVAIILITWFTFHQGTKNYLATWGTYYLIVALCVGIVVYMILVCVERARYSYPCNFILLTILTLAYGFIAAIMSSQYDTITVLCAVGSTFIAVIVIILLAKYSPFDITGCGCALCVLSIVHLILSIVLISTLVSYTNVSAVSLIISASAAFIISLYLLMDLQLIMGDRSFSLSPEEYILGATLLYVNIINLFQNMLLITSAARG